MTGPWYAAQIKPQELNNAKYWLSRAGFRHEDPFVRDELAARDVRLFPGYLLVEFSDAQPWQTINRLPGVLGLLPRRSEEPSALPRGFVERVLDSLSGGASSVNAVINRIVRGQMLHIVGGPFAGHHGKFIERGRGASLVLEVLLFNRAMQVNVLPRQVEAA